MEDLNNFRDSEEYKPVAAIRLKASTSEGFVVEGINENFKWHGIPVNIPSTYKEWFFSVITIFSLIFTVYSLIISFFD